MKWLVSFKMQMEEDEPIDPIRQRENWLYVDCTSFQSQDLKKSKDYVVVYNINIPALVVNDPAARQNALERVKMLLEEDFYNVQVDYQLTGTYWLVNSETGERKEWVGDFYSGLHNAAVIEEFQFFNKNTFVDTVFNILENVEEKLLWNGRSTKWKFERLQSIIINAQCVVPENHRVLYKRQMGKRKKKFRNTFVLPELDEDAA